MNREIKELKRIARGNLQGNFTILIRAFICCNLIVSLIETPFSSMTNDVMFSIQNIVYYIALLLITIASVVLTVGQYCLHLRLVRSGKIHLSELFFPLRHDANRLIIAEFIIFIFEMIALAPVLIAFGILHYTIDLTMCLVALGLAILGCVLTLFVSVTFGLNYFILIDNEELGVIACLKKTLALIKKHRGRSLYLQVSFWGFYILVALTFGIGALWVQPYVMQTTTLFYLDLTGELDTILEARKQAEAVPEPVIFDTYA